MAAEGRPTKGYYVTERWVAHKEFLVFAHTGKEAKEHVRAGTGEVEGIEEYYVPASITRVRRAPGEDRDA
jgi:hypothetical protein